MQTNYSKNLPDLIEQIIKDGEKIIEAGFNEMGIPFDMAIIRGRSRNPEYVKMRRVATYLLQAKEFTNSNIGRVIHRDHATVYAYLTTYGYADAPRNSQELKEMEIKRTKRLIRILDQRKMELEARI